MAESTVVKNMRDGTLTIISGADEYEVAYEQGTLSYTIPGPSVSAYLDRGKFGATPSIRFDQDQPCTGSFTAYLRDISDGTYVTLPEFIMNSGLFDSAWASTLGADAEVKTVSLRWKVNGTIHGDAADHQVQWDFVRITGSGAEGSPTLTTCNWTSYQLYPTVT